MPTIFLGDFNTPVNLAAVKTLLDKGYVDSLAAGAPNADRLATWHWKIKDFEYRLQIDHILHGPQFKTIRSRVIERDSSDHFLVASKLKWATTQPTAGRTVAGSP
jgi:endonuclease/exonuclease/phosphatase family metal-dependent hydrolase